MTTDFTNTIKHTAIYSLGNLSAKLIGFVLLPLYTTHLTLETYGKLGILETTMTIIVAIFSFKIPTAMQRWCADYSDQNQQKKIIFISFISMISIVIPLGILGFLFNVQLSELFFSTPSLAFYFTYIFIATPFEILNILPMEVLRFREKSSHYAVLQSIKLTTILGLNVYFIAYLNMGLEGILLSHLIGNALLFLITLPYILSNIKIEFDFQIAKDIFRYGSPLIFTTISTLILTLSDRYVLIFFHGYEDVGIYTLGYKIASVVGIFIFQSFTMGYLPIAYKNYGKPNFESFYTKSLTYLCIALTISLIGLSAFSQEVIKLLSNNTAYWYAYNLVPFITLIFLFKGIQYVFTLTFHFIKKTHLNIQIVSIGVVVNLILNFALIPYFKYYGAIVATNLSLIIMVILVYFKAQKHLKYKFEINKVFGIIGLTFGFIVAVYYLNDLSFELRIIPKILLPILFILCLVATKIIRLEEIKAAKAFLYNLWAGKK